MIGYVRKNTSHAELSIQQQINSLKEIGVLKIFIENNSFGIKNPEFIKALKFIKNGDKLVFNPDCMSDRTLQNLASDFNVVGCEVRLFETINHENGDQIEELCCLHCI